MNNPDVVEVTAEDREAMIAYEALTAIPLATQFASAIRCGTHDNMPRLQLIARQRIAAEQRLREQVERMARALDAIEEALDLRDYVAARVIISQARRAHNKLTEGS